jgi:S1-C subfamily serine protease
MPKRYETVAYALVFLLLGGFLLGWKLLVARVQPATIAEYQKRLKMTAENISAPPIAENPDDALRIYAVDVVHTRPFNDPFIGYGIYLGQGVVVTAAHVVGRWPHFTNPRVLIAGRDLPAKVIKEGSSEQTDLALLSLDQERLPVSLQLRRNPLCKEPLLVGMNVVVVYPERTARSQIISPLLIPSEYRNRFGTLINEAQGSGSGVFLAKKKCLIGIMSAKVTKFASRNKNGRMDITPNGFAGFFVPVSRGSNFIPSEFRF